MPTLFFADRETLRLALASGVVPLAVSRSPAVAGFDPRGGLWLNPSVPLHREALADLARFGVTAVGSAGVMDTSPIACWHQLVPLTSQPVTRPLSGTWLLSTVATRLPALAAEINRLGPRSRLHCRQHPTDAERWFVRVVDLPFTVLHRILQERDRRLEAFVEQSPGIWVEVGFELPLAGQVRPPEGRLWLVRAPAEWERIEDRSFIPAPECWPLLRCRPTRHDGLAEIRVPVRLRLTTTVAQTARLWIVRNRPHEQLEVLVRQADERLLQRLSFALGVDRRQQPVLALRFRGARGGPATLPIVGREYAPYLRLSQLFAPCDRKLTPAPRRDALRQIFDERPDQLIWLEPLDAEGSAGLFRPASLPESAFRPLSAWVRHGAPVTRVLAPSGARATSPLDPLPFTVHDEEARPRSAVRGPVPAAPVAVTPTLWQRVKGWMQRSESTEPETETTPSATPAPSVGDGGRVAPAVRRHDWQRRRRWLEARFLPPDGPPPPGQRVELWVELAGLYLALNQATESASCWLNALWESDEPPQEWLWGWLRAEAKLSRWSPGQGPPESARALAAYITWAIHEENEQAILRARAPSLIRALDDVEPHLPVRAVWLARMALAQVVGGDPLGLARCRDRLLERLYTAGPALDRDLPGFLRFAGPGGERYTAVRDWLLKARDLVQRFVTRQPPRPGEATMGPNSLPTTVLQRVGLECEDGTFTRAYASLTLAWALARLGENQAAVQLTGQARAVLHNGDPVHELLLAAYEARIGQAGQGRRPAPFPAAWQARLADLPPLSRYLVDRLRTASRILEPEERLNPYRAAVFARHRELSDLELAIVALASDDAEEMTKRVPVLLAVDAPPDVRGEILAAILDVAGRLPESIVGQVLQQTLTVIDGHPPSAVRERLSLTVRGLTLAMRLGRADVARQLADRAIRTLSGKPTPTSLSAAEPLAILAARLANREAFRSEGRRLLTQVRAWIWAETEGSSRLRRSYGAYTRLAVQVLLPGSASSALGTEDTALDLAREMLFSGRLSSRGEQAEMARAYASALGHAPIGLALGRIEEIFQRLEVVPTQMASSNSHYNLAALGVVEAVTRAVVDEDFTLGPEVRRWLDDDEYALRQRIDRDMRTLLGGASSV